MQFKCNRVISDTYNAAHNLICPTAYKCITDRYRQLSSAKQRIKLSTTAKYTMYIKVQPVKKPPNAVVTKPKTIPRSRPPTKLSQFQEKCGCFMGGFNYFKLYLATCCNHCYVYLVKNGLTWAERIFWFVFLAISNYFCISIALQSVSRFMTKNSYMGIERNYFEWNTTLPSLTICPMERLDKEEFEKYCQ